MAVRAIVYRDGKVLAVRHREHPERWATVGGGLEAGEDLVSGLRREVIEETGVEPVVDRLLFVQQYYDSEHDCERLEFLFLVTNSEDFLDIDRSATTHGELEIEEYAFIDPKAENLWPKFLGEVDLGRYVSEVLPVVPLTLRRGNTFSPSASPFELNSRNRS